MEVLLYLRPSHRRVSELLDILFRLGYTVLLAGRTVGAYFVCSSANTLVGSYICYDHKRI